MTASEFTAARRLRTGALGAAFWLSQGVAEMGLAEASEAGDSESVPVDASSAPECPAGWYCEGEGDAVVEVSPPPPPNPSRYPLSSLVARAAWVPLPQQASRRALLLGTGLAFRYRPGRVAAYEAGLLAFGGRDYLGRSRYDLGVEANLVLLTSRPGKPGPFVAVGPNFALARVDGLSATLLQLGAQLEFGGTWPLGGGATELIVEFDAFGRGRVDTAAARVPEYRDSLTGAQSNGAVGTALRLGLATDL